MTQNFFASRPHVLLPSVVPSQQLALGLGLAIEILI